MCPVSFWGPVCIIESQWKYNFMLHSELGPVMLSYGKPALPEASDTITATRANPAKYLNVLPILLLFLPEAFLNAFKGLFFVWGWDVQSSLLLSKWHSPPTWQWLHVHLRTLRELSKCSVCIAGEVADLVQVTRCALAVSAP